VVEGCRDGERQAGCHTVVGPKDVDAEGASNVDGLQDVGVLQAAMLGSTTQLTSVCLPMDGKLGKVLASLTKADERSDVKTL
jgi:hypothetical protein